MKRVKEDTQSLSLFDTNIINDLTIKPTPMKYKPKKIFKKISGNIFKDKQICFTGKLEYFTRNGAKFIVEDIGGKFVNSVTHKTDFLIVGDLSYQAGITQPNKSHKLITAETYQKKGFSIRIMSEEEFFKILRKNFVVKNIL